MELHFANAKCLDISLEPGVLHFLLVILCYQYDLSVIGLAYVTKCVLMNIRQVRMVRSARLFKFILINGQLQGFGGGSP